MQEMHSQSMTKVDILTVGHHLSGYVTTGDRRFSTWLNLRDQPTITLENVDLRSLHDLEGTEVSLGFVLVNRDSVVAAIPRESGVLSMPKEREQRPLEYVEKTKHEVVVSLAPFALRGHVHLARDADLRRSLTRYPDSFMPITEARIVYTPNPKLLWEGEVVLINRDRAQLYWPALD